MFWNIQSKCQDNGTKYTLTKHNNMCLCECVCDKNKELVSFIQMAYKIDGIEFNPQIKELKNTHESLEFDL